MIVFTIYKNGGNAGVLGASFSCAVFGVRGSSGGNSGARCLARVRSCEVVQAVIRARFMFGRALFNGGVQVFGFGFGFAVSRSGGTD